MTYKELNDLVNTIKTIIGDQETKTQKKLFKIFEKIKPTFTEYQNKIEDLRLDNAATDDKGVLILDDKGNYKFNKEGLKNLTKQINELNEQSFTFTKIPVVNPQGLENFVFLKDWLDGVTFVEEEAEEEL